MYKSPSSQKERIILLPDDTEQRYKEEQKLYRKEARSLIMKGLMDTDEQNNLLENLRLLNVHERCAQSLEHEFGHVLNVRELETLKITPNDASLIYKWFLDAGYIFNIDKRFPDFGGLSVWDKLHILKEGVDLMKRMLNNQITSQARRPASSSDFDSIIAFHQVVGRRKKKDWVAGSQSLTEDIIRRDLEELERSALNQVAATKLGYSEFVVEKLFATLFIKSDYMVENSWITHPLG
ncbi:hypothetical protein [Paenibacillus zanthoxyli]|uniref:hypothetical protein n=1 Tax=Paenibacillus zanthoxyli TaxID=369399 RepID=UPI000471B96F|nr:hypothetical protein [Paenibacillus zanthoxyli]